jgi:hypothetical protein
MIPSKENFERVLKQLHESEKKLLDLTCHYSQIEAKEKKRREKEGQINAQIDNELKAILIELDDIHSLRSLTDPSNGSFTEPFERIIVNMEKINKLKDKNNNFSTGFTKMSQDILIKIKKRHNDTDYDLYNHLERSKIIKNALSKQYFHNLLQLY